MAASSSSPRSVLRALNPTQLSPKDVLKLKDLVTLQRTSFVAKALGTSLNIVGGIGFALAASSEGVGAYYFIYMGLGVTGAVLGSTIHVLTDWVRNIAAQRSLRGQVGQAGQQGGGDIKTEGEGDFIPLLKLDNYLPPILAQTGLLPSMESMSIYELVRGPHPEWRLGSQFLKTIQANLTLFKMFLANLKVIDGLVKFAGVQKDYPRLGSGFLTFSKTLRVIYRQMGERVLGYLCVLAGASFVIIDLWLLREEWRAEGMVKAVEEVAAKGTSSSSAENIAISEESTEDVNVK